VVDGLLSMADVEGSGLRGLANLVELNLSGNRCGRSTSSISPPTSADAGTVRIVPSHSISSFHFRIVDLGVRAACFGMCKLGFDLAAVRFRSTPVCAHDEAWRCLGAVV
jgi:hypothetical protein